jgi:hypothetical protein
MEANRPTKLYVINTASGVRLDLDNPRPEAILIEDVAGGLSKVCRFGAQALEYYSVAQHALLVQRLADATEVLENMVIRAQTKDDVRAVQPVVRRSEWADMFRLRLGTGATLSKRLPHSWHP